MSALIENPIMGEEWLSDAFDVPPDVVREGLAFYDANREHLEIKNGAAGKD